MLQEYTCEKCEQPIKFETYRDMNLVLWINHNEPDHAMCMPCWDSLSEKEKTKIYNKAWYRPQIYTRGMMEWWYPKYKRIEFKLIEYINEHPHAPRCYDCMEHGIAHIRNIAGDWYVDWLKPVPLPDSLRGELEERDGS